MLMIAILSIFNKKIRHHLFNQSKSIISAKKNIDKNYNKDVILLHAASTGEYEQLMPIIKKINRHDFFILQTYFSPTAYSKNNKSYNDAFCYHPFDFIWSAWFFLKKTRTKYYITTRNDLWPNHLYIAKKLSIKTILINANLYKSTHYNSFFLKKINKIIYNNFDLILTGSNRLKNNLKMLIDSKKIKITGDSRLDRIIERKNNFSKEILPIKFKKNKTLILGSLIPSDFPIVFNGLKKYYFNGKNIINQKKHNIIIVPHEINLYEINYICEKLTSLKFNWTFFSKINSNLESNVVIIDQIGLLADLYYYSDLAYIGGGFNGGVHSVMEPAVYTNIISYGPNYKILDIAVDFANKKIAKTITTINDFYNFLKIFDNKEILYKSIFTLKKYMSTKSNSTNKIIDSIFHENNCSH